MVMKTMDLQLGWLEAFVATARHLSYKLAAIELGEKPGETKRHVLQLERWLHRVLVLDAPLELNEEDGEWFLPIATNCLELFSDAKASPNDPPSKLMLRKSKTSDIRLADLQTFIKIVEHGSFKETAYEIGCSHDQARRNIRSLSGALGKTLLEGRSILRPTDDGIRFLETAKFIFETLLHSQAIIPDGYDPVREQLRKSANTVDIYSMKLSPILSQFEQKRKMSKIDQFEITEGKKTLKNLDDLSNAISNFLASKA